MKRSAKMPLAPCEKMNATPIMKSPTSSDVTRLA
jgi:hypothetical protein